MTETANGGRPRVRDAFAVERREQITRILNEHGRVRTAELAHMLSVTEPTVRKDIVDLENQGLLVRTHGGAVARGSMAEVDISARVAKYAEEKRVIARACLELIRDGDSIYLDGGTTQYEMARLLAGGGPGAARKQGVKILTNSFKVAEICGESSVDPPVVLGGRYRPTGGCFVGPITVSTLRQFRVDIAFVGVTGITSTGFCAADIGEAQIKTEAINRAARAVIPMDHSKIGLADFITICSLNDVHTVVTDRADPELEEWLGESNVELIIGQTLKP